MSVLIYISEIKDLKKHFWLTYCKNNLSSLFWKIPFDHNVKYYWYISFEKIVFLPHYTNWMNSKTLKYDLENLSV